MLLVYNVGNRDRTPGREPLASEVHLVDPRQSPEQVVLYIELITHKTLGHLRSILEPYATRRRSTYAYIIRPIARSFVYLRYAWPDTRARRNEAIDFGF